MASKHFVLIVLLLLFKMFIYVQCPALQFQDVIVPEGQNFPYTCCANNMNSIIFRWGLFNRLYPEPVPLYSTATVKEGTQLKYVWTEDFNASIYYKRVEIVYNPTTRCLTWLISPVQYGDGNSFHAIFRDDQAFGKQFKPCNVLKLFVKKSTQALPTSSTPMPSSDFVSPLKEDAGHTKTTTRSDVYTKESTATKTHLGLVSPTTKGAGHVTHKTTTRGIYTKESTDDETRLSTGLVIIVIIVGLGLVLVLVTCLICFGKMKVGRHQRLDEENESVKLEDRTTEDMQENGSKEEQPLKSSGSKKENGEGKAVSKSDQLLNLPDVPEDVN